MNPLPEEAPFVRPLKPLSEQRILVIGAGPAGLSVLVALAQASQNGQQIPQIVCYERQDQWGGQWNATWRTGVDQYGEPQHSGMYPQLWSNGPKECLEFANYTFLQHFGQDVGSYPPREVLREYIQGRAWHFGVESFIQYHKAVRRVTFDETTQMFHVLAQDLQTLEETSAPVAGTTARIDQRREHEQDFDYVFCCTGHFHVPNVPSFPGFDTFQGRILHSHDVRDFRLFQDQRLLIVGTSYSAEDVAVQAYKFGCRNIVLSYRTAPMPFHWPENAFSTRPLLTSIQDGNVAHFSDGTFQEVDVIVLATGYRHSFPFMEQKLQLSTDNVLWIDALYKGIFFNPNPRLLYMAMHDQWLTFNMFDAQAYYARDVILGRLQIPDQRQDEMQTWAARDQAAQDDEAKIRFQVDYTADLVEATDYPSWDYELTVQTFLEWEHAKHKDIFGYRNQIHRSAFTDTVSPKPAILWKDNMDDTVQAFLRNHS